MSGSTRLIRVSWFNEIEKSILVGYQFITFSSKFDMFSLHTLKVVYTNALISYGVAVSMRH